MKFDHQEYLFLLHVLLSVKILTEVLVNLLKSPTGLTQGFPSVNVLNFETEFIKPYT